MKPRTRGRTQRLGSLALTARGYREVRREALSLEVVLVHLEKPAAKGALAVILNPPAWLFLATAASSLMVSATQAGGTSTAVLAALALLLGVMAGDGTLVLASGLGLRRARSDVGRILRQILSIVLGLLGAALILSGLLP